MTPSEGELQPGWGTRSPWLLDRSDEEAGREEQYSPTVEFHLDDEWSVQSKRQQKFPISSHYQRTIHSGGSFDDSCLKQKVASFSPHVHV